LIIKDFALGSDLAYHNFPNSVFATNVGYRQMDAMLRTAKLARRVQQAIREKTLASTDASGLLQTAYDVSILEAELRGWHLVCLETCTYETISAIPHKGPSRFPTTLHVFPNLIRAMAWTNYWAMQVRVLRLSVECASYLNEAGIQERPFPSKMILLARLADCFDHLCGTIAYLCGSATEDGKPSDPSEIRGNFSGTMLAMYALNTLIGTREVETLRPGMRSWCLGYLTHIGSNFAIKQAHAFHRLHTIRLQQNSAVPEAIRLP